jgi:colicin import membrane protein
MSADPDAVVVPDVLGVGPPADGPIPPPRRPNLRGDLDSVLEFLPCFRGALRGYDRWQVDSYVSWAERELRAARRSADEMAARFGACSAELERTRRQLERSEDGRDVLRVSDRMAQVLELAADEAAALTAAGAAEADELVDRARTYAAAMLQRAREAEDAAAAATEAAARVRAEAADLLEHARTQAAELRASAVAERHRLDTEAAARRTQLEQQARHQREQEAAAGAEAVAAAQREVDALHGRREQARESLRRLTDQVTAALQVLATTQPTEPPDARVSRPVQPTR